MYEFAYADGRWSDRPSAPVTPPRGKARKGQLFVLADVDGKDASETAEQIRADVGDSFYRDPSGSLTSALVRAIQRVNQDLFAENERSIRSDRQYATLCCAVFRDGEAYFALAGRGLGYLIRIDRGERFGRGDPRPGQRPIDLVGQADEIDVELHHRTIDAPTAIILTSSGLIDLVGEHSDDALRGQPNRVLDGLRAIGREHRGQRSFRTLVVVPESENDFPAADTDDESSLDLTPPPPTPRSRRSGKQFRLPRRVAAPEEPLADYSFDDDDDLPATRPRGAAFADDEWDELEAFKPRRRFSSHFSLPRSPSQLVVAVVAVAILFFVGYLGVLIAARILQGGAPYTDAMSNLSQAQQREREAMGQSDPLVRRHLLGEANQMASAALTAQPDDPLTITTSARIRREYQAASGIVDLPAIAPLAALPTAGDQMILNGVDLYILDRTNSRIYKYLLSADGATIKSSPNPILVQSGDRIGPVTVNKLTRIAWMPSSSNWPTASLLALDSSGFLIQYEPAHGLTVLNLRDPGSWGAVTALGAYDGSIYALNTTQQTLASYPTQSSGFDGPVYNYFAPEAKVNLSDAVNLAVNGDLYLLHATGQIQKFTGGKPVSFAGPPGDLLPSHPAGLAVGDDSVFIGDPGNARIIQLTREGVYTRTLSAVANPSVLANMRDLAVSESGKDLYVLAGDKLYRCPLPELSQ